GQRSSLPRQRASISKAVNLGQATHRRMPRARAYETNLPREVPRLCRGGSSSLTIQAVVHRTDSRIVSHHAHEREFDDGGLRKPKPHQVGLQISCGVHSQVPQEDAVCGIETTSRGGVPQAGPAKGKPHRGRSSDAGPCPHDDLHSTKIRRFAGDRLYQGKSAIHLALVYGERKRNFEGQHFWARGYFVSTVGRDEAVIREYIRKQEQEDARLEQLNMWR